MPLLNSPRAVHIISGSTFDVMYIVNNSITSQTCDRFISEIPCEQNPLLYLQSVAFSYHDNLTRDTQNDIGKRQVEIETHRPVSRTSP